jgi:hypothetical protein
MNNQDIPFFVTYIFLLLIVFKNMIIGGDFNFWYWFKYGKIYSNWHNNREEFKDFLKQQNWYKEIELAKKILNNKELVIMKKDSIYYKTVAEKLCEELKMNKVNLILIWNKLMGAYIDGRNDEKEELIKNARYNDVQ